jgi:hypothetical protein
MTDAQKIIDLLEEIKNNTAIIAENTKPKKIKRIVKRGTMTEQDFEEVYREYPRKIGKEKGRAIFMRLDRNLIPKIKESFKQFNGVEKQYIPHFSTFMNNNRWEDEVEDNALANFLKLKTEEWRNIWNYTTELPPQSKIESWTNEFYS